jgi:glycosyltransferase involved in cell wall biosynthesis
LRNAVESVAEQTYDDIELLVVDDHSPTPAEETLSGCSFGDMRVTCIRHSENRGANEARNTGIRHANGEYVAFLDDDDDWDPTKIERQVETFRRAEDDVGVVYTGSEYVYDDYERTVIFSVTGDVTTDILTGKSVGEFTTLMVEHDVIEEAGLPDTRFPSWQDREWQLRLSEHCRFEVVPEALTTRRRVTEDDRISDNYEEKRDVSYPLFLEKHRDTAAAYGLRYERAFVASMSEGLGQCALKNGYYADARKYLLKSLYYDPFEKSRWIYAIVSLGGKPTYRSAHELARTAHKIRSSPIEK